MVIFVLRKKIKSCILGGVLLEWVFKNKFKSLVRFSLDIFPLYDFSCYPIIRVHVGTTMVKWQNSVMVNGKGPPYYYLEHVDMVQWLYRTMTLLCQFGLMLKLYNNFCVIFEW